MVAPPQSPVAYPFSCAHARTGAARLTIEQGVAMGRASRLVCSAGERVRVAGDAVVLFETTVDL